MHTWEMLKKAFPIAFLHEGAIKSLEIVSSRRTLRSINSDIIIITLHFNPMKFTHDFPFSPWARENFKENIFSRRGSK